MALPSQTARPMSRATAMYRRRRARFGPMLVVLLLIAVAGIGAWRLWPRATDAGGPPDDDRMASAALDGGRAPAIDPSITSRALPTDGRGTGDDPVIEMGGAVPPRRPVVATPPAVTNDAPPKSADPIRPNPGYIVAPASTPGATAPIAPVAVPADPGSSSSASAKARLRSGLELQAARRWVEARSVLTAAYTSSELSAADRSTARQALESINEVLVFGPTVVPGDPFAFEYTIKSGDWLERIVRTEKGATDWRFVQRINRIPRPEGIQAGRPLKLIRGPFHAVVSKPDY
ncbi:MAG: hypothetical protein KDA25_12585, partial [Phycisphaerales bacterium]|nr:hypothetical protein [Phycisphaerales bacterium]